MLKIGVLGEKTRTDGKIFLLFQGEKPGPGAQADFSRDDFSAKAGECAILRRGQVSILAGLGKRAEFEPERVRQAGGAAATACKKTSAKSFEVLMPAFKSLSKEDAARLFSEGALLCDYDFDKYKTKKDEEDIAKEKRADFFISGQDKKGGGIEEGIRLGIALAGAANYARDINNEPPNVANAEFIAGKAKELARSHGLKIAVIGTAELGKAGLHGIAAVSSASKTPGRLVVLEYRGKPDRRAGKAPIVFVGKGITFDSGGISIKPGKDMDRMRWDKSGACAVLGILKAAAELKIKAKVVGVLALAENMPAGFGYRPGDIIKSGGRAIEILNTDAEGRIVLSDALSYVREKIRKPRAVIDFATLTGACVVALGSHASGIMGNDQKLIGELARAAEKSGEKVWQLPLWKEYAEMIKGKHGDIKNVGEPGGEAGTITAACFLKEFVGDWPWAHVDIAGTAYQAGYSAKPYQIGRASCRERV